MLPFLLTTVSGSGDGRVPLVAAGRTCVVACGTEWAAMLYRVVEMERQDRAFSNRNESALK